VNWKRAGESSFERAATCVACYQCRVGLEARYDFVFRKTTKELGCQKFDDYLVVEATRDQGATASGRSFRFTHPWIEHPKGLSANYLAMPVGLLREEPQSYAMYEDGDFSNASPPFQLDGDARREFFAMQVRHDVVIGEHYATICIQSQSKDIASLMVATDSLRWIDCLMNSTGAEFVTCRSDYSTWLIAPGLSLCITSGEYALAPPRSSGLGVDSFASHVAERSKSLRELMAR
jgi:hypothetical protein